MVASTSAEDRRLAVIFRKVEVEPGIGTRSPGCDSKTQLYAHGSVRRHNRIARSTGEKDEKMR